MSLGPPSKVPKETSITSMKMVANSTFYSLKKDPAPGLFYIGITLLLIGLPLNVNFPSMYYVVLIVLGIIGISTRPAKPKKET